MKFLDFFAGIGGFRKGMELAGHECVGFCEWDKYATASYTSMHLITDSQREYLATLPLKKRQKEIIKKEYRNGEWYADDIRSVDAGSLPHAECWCFGFPCQDISVAGKQAGFSGHRSSLFFAVTKLIRELEEKDRPVYLFIENVKNLLSVNNGFDFARLLIELDEIGYDAEWAVLNTKDFGVPQNRERVFVIGHLRGRSGSEVFPVERTDGENYIRQLGNYMPTATRNNPNQGRINSVDGIAPCLNKMDGGGREPSIALPIFCDMNYGRSKFTENARCLQARYHKGISNMFGANSGVAIPVLTPERVNKRQNGRRFKENMEPMFTLTGQDRHGVAVKVKEATLQGYAIAYEGDSINLAVPGSKARRGRVGERIANTLDTGCNQGILARVSDELTVHAIWSEKYQCYLAVRRLTPKECFRLQGWTDGYFERAKFVNSDSQLYKQAGNGVTVHVIYEIAKKMR